jgi:hypothetical protein
MGLPGGETPYELPKAKTGFTDGYDTYDTSAERPGDPSQWRSAIETAKPQEPAPKPLDYRPKRRIVTM